MIQVKDGKVIQTVLPQTGELSDGRTVSGYHVLPAEILAAEGWLPEEEVKPLYDPATEQLAFDRYEILKDKVNIIYKVETLPEPAPDPFLELQSKVNEQEVINKKLQDLLVTKEVITLAEKETLLIKEI